MSVRKSGNSREIVEYHGNGQFMPVGQKFYLGCHHGDVYQVVENHDCAGCGLILQCNGSNWTTIPNCDKHSRKDGKDVIFQLL